MVYNFGIHLFGIVLKILAAFNPKIRKGCIGRSKTFTILERNVSATDNNFWFHCASLGEYEQGLPVFSRLKKEHPDYKIILSFFSPSGYEIRKNTELADTVVYLPIDTKSNAERFVALVNPKLTVFVKYEIWPNLLSELKAHNLKSILISGLFRRNQAYFRWYGAELRRALKSFDHIFVQNKVSQTLLKSIDYNRTSISGDTRYDRVSEQLDRDNTLTWLQEFKGQKKLMVFGSTWQEDEELLLKYINDNENKDFKYLIAPHEIRESRIAGLNSKIKLASIKFTEINGKHLSNYKVIILDTIGLLSKAYSYADLAYVGGAMGSSGLHNILEPAVFGIPIVIGKNFENFPEAKELQEMGGLYSVRDFNSLKETLDLLSYNDKANKVSGSIASDFINKKKGAVIQIMNHIRI